MVLSQENTTTVQLPETTVEAQRVSKLQLPQVFWAAVIIASVNAMLVAWFFLSPNLTIRTDLERLHPLDERGVISKVSPFDTYHPDPVKRPRVVAATKMRPVVESAEVSYDPYMPVATASAMPVAAAAAVSNPAQPTAVRANYVSGSRVYEVLETQMQKVSRVSASLTEPMRRMSERALQHIETRIAPAVSDPGKSLQPLR